GDLLRGGARLLRRRRDLLARRRGRLGDVGDLADVALHARRALRRLTDGGDDVCRAGDHRVDGRADRLERLAGALDGGRALAGAASAVLDDVDRVAGVGLDRADERGDRAGGAARLLGELADLVGDDREAAAVLAGPRRLDGGVQRQQVRLLGDAGDRVDDP